MLIRGAAKLQIISLVLAMCGLLSLSGPALASVGSDREVTEAYGKLPLYFIENQGQADGRVRYYEKGHGHTISFADDVVKFTLKKPSAAAGVSVSLTPLGMREGLRPEAADRQEGVIRYYKGSDREKWKNNIPTYGTVLYRDAYPGIDLKFYGSNRQLEYDVIVKPGADPSQVRFLYSGMESIEVAENGDLSIKMKDGSAIIQHKPIVYQIINGERIAVDGKFTVRRDDSAGSEGKSYTCGFEVASYDKERSLVIDPVISIASYLGGESIDEGLGVAVDSAGNIFVVGATSSGDFPDINAYQNAISGAPDAFVTKFKAAGNQLVYSTFLGGDDNDTAKSAAVDAAGNVYVVGVTDSYDFPTQDAYQETNAGDSDVFLAKLDDDGLLFSTYFGGSASDGGNGIAVDAQGVIYITGFTGSGDDFPISDNAKYPDFGGGDYDAFVAKFKTDGSDFAYSSFLGGTGNDEGNGIAVDKSKNFYVTGSTRSEDFPIVGTVFQAGYEGELDAFVTKFTSKGGVAYSSFHGGSDNDIGKAIVVDTDNCAVVTGSTTSEDLKTKAPYQKNNAGGQDAFLIRVIDTGKSLMFSTYLGGVDGDSGNGIAVNSKGDVLVVGDTVSTDFPTKNKIKGQECYESGDGFLAQFTKAGALTFSSCFGGDDNDTARAVTLDKGGNVYIAGTTWSSDFPTTSKAFQKNLAGESDAFVAKIGTAPPVADFSANKTSGTAPLDVKFTDKSTPAGTITKWSWDFGDGGKSAQQNPSHTYDEPGTFTVKLTVTGATGTSTKTMTKYITVKKPAPPKADFSLNPPKGYAPFKVKFTNRTSGSVTSYKWNFGDGGTSTDQSPMHIFKKPGKYTVTLKATGPGGSSTKTKQNCVTVLKGGKLAEGAEAEVGEE